MHPMSVAAAPKEADLVSYLRVLWRHKWVILLVTLLGGLAAAGFAYQKTPLYTSSAQILLQSSSPAAALVNPNSFNDLTPTDVATQIQVATSAPVQQVVAAKLHEPAPGVSVTEVGTSNVIQIAATSPVPRTAATVANAYANAYINVRQTQDVKAALSAATSVQKNLNAVNAQIASLEAAGANASGTGTSGTTSTTSSTAASQLSSLLSQQATLQSQLSSLQATASLQSGAAELISPAVTPSRPSSPDTKRTALFGLGIGLVLGVGGVLLADALDDRIRSPEELSEVAGQVPVLGMVPAVPVGRKALGPLLPSIDAPTSTATEAYRQLRTSLQFLDPERDWKLVQLTSSIPGEGKTTTATNLAVMLAEAGRKTLLIDADLRRPQAHQVFGIEQAPGLTSILLGELDLDQAVQKVEGLEHLRVLPSGPVPPNPAEVLAGARMGRLLEEIRSRDADAVIFDTPPILPVADALALAPRVDATMVVVQARRTSAKSLKQSLERLEQVNAHITGVVLNALRPQRGRGYAYGQYYPYAYNYQPHSEPAAVSTNGARVSSTMPSPGIDG